MSQQNDQDRNQPATPKRRKEFRERGENARSREVATVLLLLSGTGCVALLAPWIGARMGGLMRTCIGNADGAAPGASLAHASGAGLGMVLPVFAVCALVAVLANVCQGDLALSPKALRPRFERINPLPRLRQVLFSGRTVLELLKAIGKTALLGGLTAWFISEHYESALTLVRSGPGSLAAALGASAVRLGGYGALALAAVAAMDLIYTRWSLEKRMRMTHKEVKDEHKEQEGDPLLRSRRRQRHREMTMNQVVAEVPKADVVVTNPTHLAVALRYDRTRWDAPRVTAKGADSVALRIRSLARQHGVPVVENRSVARALHKSVKVGHGIDPTLFQAVAEIYAFLYRRRGGGR